MKSATIFFSFTFRKLFVSKHSLCAVHECACCFGLLVPSLSRNSAAAWPGSGIFPLPWPPLLPSSPSCSGRRPAARCPLRFFHSVPHFHTIPGRFHLAPSTPRSNRCSNLGHGPGPYWWEWEPLLRLRDHPPATTTVLWSTKL